ncbi:competence type IV pilus minor pilin ComGG [Streptococcus loxodontisalivarius]
MAAVFTLLLQFYIARVTSQSKLAQEQLLSQKAYVSALMVGQMAEQTEGDLILEDGSVHYQKEGAQLALTVKLKDRTYQFHLPQTSKEAQPLPQEKPTEANQKIKQDDKAS